MCSYVTHPVTVFGALTLGQALGTQRGMKLNIWNRPQPKQGLQEALCWVQAQTQLSY